MSRTATTHVAPQTGGFLLTQRHRGACTEQTAGLFFDDGGPAGRSAEKRQQAAKAICRLCPILHACRAYAHADPGLEGIWGGQTQAERHATRRRGADTALPAGDNEEGRRLAVVAAELTRRDGLDAAATALKVPPAELQRVLGLYGLDQPCGAFGSPAPSKGGESASPPPRRPATTSSSRTRGRRSRPSSPSRAGQSPGPTAPAHPRTPVTRPPDQPPIRHESPSTPARPKERT
jgi:WhiB family transcriptional regulator, redox-sensing transcriptional regulator